MLEVGTKAPDFTLPDQNGENRSLSDYTGRKVILYFYPKDMTSGCTRQACGNVRPSGRWTSGSGIRSTGWKGERHRFDYGQID